MSEIQVEAWEVGGTGGPVPSDKVFCCPKRTFYLVVKTVGYEGRRAGRPEVWGLASFLPYPSLETTLHPLFHK